MTNRGGAILSTLYLQRVNSHSEERTRALLGDATGLLDFGSALANAVDGD